jgi:hypothetical protein
MLGGVGLACPTYIKCVKINNKSNEAFKVSVTHDSGKSHEVTIAPHETKLIE